MMPPFLPNDVLFLICEALFEQKEFHTLFCCSLASKSLAVPAVSNLYRMQETAPVTTGGVEDAPQNFGRDTTQGWANLWRTLILSCLEKTAYSYYKYIRTLDLGNLQSLLDDSTFRTKYAGKFFAGDLSDFLIEIDNPPPSKKRRKQPPKRLDSLEIVRKVGGLITSKVTMIQELAGPLDTAQLKEWVPRLRYLRSLRLWDGMELKGVGPVLREHCANFCNLTFYHARADSADECLAEFLRDLKPNTLQAFMVASFLAAEDELFKAFNHHASSLTSLELRDLSGEGLTNMANMNECTALKTLSLITRSAPTLETNASPPLPSLVAWLRSCQDLSDLTFQSSYDSQELFPQLLTPLLLDDSVRLARLSVINYGATAYHSPATAAFYGAITNQAATLQSLFLNADGETVDNDALAGALAYLQNLTDLRLQKVSDFFQNRHIATLAAAMPVLEDLWVGGWSVTDQVWDSFALLQDLKRLEISAFAAFTFEGILAFIHSLDPLRQRGFLLSIMMADPKSELARNEDAQNLLRLELAQQVEGRFEYTKARDPDQDEFSSSDSD